MSPVLATGRNVSSHDHRAQDLTRHSHCLGLLTDILLFFVIAVGFFIIFVSLHETLTSSDYTVFFFSFFFF